MANVFIEESTMQAIGDAIRAKTGGTEGILPEDMPTEIASIETGDNFYDAFWDAFQDNGNRTHYAYGFAGRGWRDATFQPKYPLNNISNAASMFSNGMYLGEIPAELDLDLSNSSDCSYLFNSCISLRTVGSIKFNNNIAQSKNNYLFSSCTGLKNITINSEIAFNISFSSSSQLTPASMKSVILHLRNCAGTSDEYKYTVTFQDSCWTALEADSTAPDGGTWKDYVKGLGWNV